MAEEFRELDFHLDRLDASIRELWAARSLDLHMCDGSVKLNQFGLLHDIRIDVMAIRRARTETAQEQLNPTNANVNETATDGA